MVTNLPLLRGLAVVIVLLCPAGAEYACGRQQSCYNEPSNCTYGDCSFQVVWEKVSNGTQVSFKLAAEVDGYVAVGISEDRRMGRDDVLMCMVDGNGDVTFQHRYNDGRTNIAADMDGFTVTEKKYEKGVVTCRVNRDLSITNNGITFDMGANDYYMLFAQGSIVNGNPVQHNEIPKVTPVKVSLADIVIVDATQPLNDEDSLDGDDAGAVIKQGVLAVLLSAVFGVLFAHQ